MKIGIITYHFPYNSGAALQCVALQTALEKLGHEVQVINYRPWYHQIRYTPKKNILFVIRDHYANSGHRNPVKRSLSALYKGAKAVHFNLFKAQAFRISENKFARFVNSYMKETRLYRTLEELRADPPDCDAIISGSDQLWNTEQTKGGFDPAYFLSFAPKGCTKMTYAVGVNFADNVSNVAEVKRLIAGMDAISLREEKYYRTIRRISRKDMPIHQDLDPTLLHEADVYAQFESKTCSLPKGPYILTYTMNDKIQGRVYAAAKKLAKETGLPVIDITGNPLRKEAIFGVPTVKAGPDEFLSYIKSARYVVTNSFHGTAFSIIYRKQFVVIPHSKTGNRVTDLLHRLGLDSRWSNAQEKALEIVKSPVDYTAAETKIAALRQESLDFISSVCGAR